MLAAGLVLFVVGVLVMAFTTGDAERLGKLVAVAGVIVIAVWIVLELVDEADEEGGGDLDTVVPLIPALLGARLRSVSLFR